MDDVFPKPSGSTLSVWPGYPAPYIGDWPCLTCGHFQCICAYRIPTPPWVPTAPRVPTVPVPPTTTAPNTAVEIKLRPAPTPDGVLAEALRLAGENALLKRRVEDLEAENARLREKTGEAL